MEERRGAEEDEEFKPSRRGWWLGAENFREELLTQMSERMGAEHHGVQNTGTKAGLYLEAMKWVGCGGWVG